MSAIVRKYLMGSHYVNAMAKLAASDVVHLRSATKTAIGREKARQQRENSSHSSKLASHWKHAAHLATLRWRRSRTHYQEHLNICNVESMSGVDPFDGEKIRGGQRTTEKQENNEVDDLLTISPEVDGRLKDEGR